MEHDNTFDRCLHDKENPYVMISRELVRDKSISPECRWLIIFLLTNTEGFTIRAKQIINHLKGFKNCGRDRIYQIIDEAIEAGYLCRVEIKMGNLVQGYRYFVSERPKYKEANLKKKEDDLKKSFRRPGSQDTGAQDTEGTDYKKEQENSSLKKEQFEESATPLTPQTSQVEKGEPAKNAAEDLLNEFKRSLKDPGQAERAVKYYQAHEAELKAKAKSSPKGLCVTKIRNNEDLEEVKRFDLIEKRKKWAQQHEVTGIAGCLTACIEGIESISGTIAKFIRYDQENQFWADRGLAST